MPATITASGTWSALDDQNPTSPVAGSEENEVLRQHYDTHEQRFQPRSLDAKQLPNDVDGLQEVNQFIGLFAAGYGIPAGVAMTRIRDIIEGFQNTIGPSEGIYRTYEP